ncbi:MAG: hypothetical protein H7Y60_05850 [Rhodospirillaceae bacterium]|nr:hypothetical protein [Rhodospirillales bacterium]
MFMKVAAALTALLLAATPAFAADKEFDLGFARPGMMQGQFRFGAWPAGVKVFCSDDKDRPEELDKAAFLLPKGIARLGASRCGLFAKDDAGWRQYRLEVAGWSTEVWGMFFPDGAGQPRLVQLFLKQPKESFETLSTHFAGRFGPPKESKARLARWSNSTNDAAIIEDGGTNLHAYVIDNRLQESMNVRMSQHPTR